MQTRLADFIRDTAAGREADEILRKCVHCGFCTATCPTYQLFADELDGPRGRIYLIKQLLEGQPVSEKTRLHLDRCLTCRSCETTCPSGVRYSRLVDIGRHLVEERLPRHGMDRVVRWVLRETVPRAAVFGAALKAAQAVRNMLPARLREHVPEPGETGPWPAPRHARRMLALAGCVQPALAPSINAAAARVLDALGISLVEQAGAGCCGAVRHHLHDQAGGLDDARRNIDAWWPAIERGEVEALAMTASGCGLQVREYGHLLRNDPAYAERAARVSAMTRDLSEIVTAESASLEALLVHRQQDRGPLAFHAPCSLQHGQGVRGMIEKLLGLAGYRLTPVRDAHLCCGSAGTYSLLQPEISGQLRDNKLAALHEGEPALIATANIGCLHHLQGGSPTPVRHWIELIDGALKAG